MTDVTNVTNVTNVTSVTSVTNTTNMGVTSPFDADAAVQKKEEKEEGVVD